MQYLGEFLSTTNSISEDQDTITKYFYYRPDKYDDPDADLETIFDLRAVTGFPQIGDLLSENNDYQIINIDIAKRLDDTTKGVKNVSYVVTCTYGRTASILVYEGYYKKDQLQAKKNGDPADNRTPPWDMQNTYTRTPIQVEIPLIKSYDNNNDQTVDVVNAAGKRLLASTSRYRFEYNVKIRERYQQSYYNNISRCLINDSNWDPETRGIGPFPAKTCLIFPPTWNWLYWEKPRTNDNTNPEYIGYYEYTVKFIYDPQGWDKKLLNIGNWARFSANAPAEQIYSYRTITQDTWSTLNYGNLAAVERARQTYSASGVVYEKVSEPLPLTSGGFVFTNAIVDPEHNPYMVLSFQEFPTYDFDLFADL